MRVTALKVNCSPVPPNIIEPRWSANTKNNFTLERADVLKFKHFLTLRICKHSIFQTSMKRCLVRTVGLLIFENNFDEIFFRNK